jgi:hypothetical protein
MQGGVINSATEGECSANALQEFKISERKKFRKYNNIYRM